MILQYITLQKKSSPVKIKRKGINGIVFILTEGMKMERIFRLRKHFRKSKNPVAKLAGVFCGVILECYHLEIREKVWDTI